MENLDKRMLQEKPRKRKIKILIGILLSLILLSASFGGGMLYVGKSEVAKAMARNSADYAGKVLNMLGAPPPDKLSRDIDFNLFWQTWDLLKENYVDKDQLNDKKMFYGALRGLVGSLDDPYTVFMDPVISSEFSNDLAGKFEGIGAEIGLRNDIITIISPLADMPAAKAGLKAGDKILAIDGKSTAGFSIEEAVHKIRGPKDSMVTLTIFRDGFKKAEDYKITRGVIMVKSVRTEMRQDKIFVVKLTNFNGDTGDLFKQAVRQIVEQSPKGIILDLRNNPGGYLEIAVDVASEWIETGPVVTQQYSRDKKDEYLTNGRARLKDFPTVVLVNEGSASASEIVAGALKDYDKAITIGKKTFGKGLVQTVKDLEDGSSVKITTAKWLTPKGSYINEKGIEPNEIVDLTQDDLDQNKDPQMERGVEILSKK